VKVQPKASTTRIQGVHGAGAQAVLKIAVRAPPTEGKANKAVLALVAKTLGLPPSSLGLVRGGGARQKEILIPGLAPRQVLKLLLG